MTSDSTFLKNGAGVQTQGWTLIFKRQFECVTNIYSPRNIYVFNLKLVMNKQIQTIGQEWWCTPAKPALRRLRLENPRFKASLS